MDLPGKCAREFDNLAGAILDHLRCIDAHAEFRTIAKEFRNNLRMPAHDDQKIGQARVAQPSNVLQDRFPRDLQHQFPVEAPA
jgi:hypothetical protein